MMCARLPASSGSTHVLEGSVRKAGQQLRVTAQLIRASDGMQLWSQTYDRNLVDIFKVQDEIGEQVSQALHVALRERSPSRLSPNLRAYNLVSGGKLLQGAKDAGRCRKGGRIVPASARHQSRLRAGLGTPRERLLERGNTCKGPPSEDQNRRVLEALNRAMQLDPNLAWAYYTRAGFEMNVTWDWAAAQADTERMRAIDPQFELLPSAFGDIALAFGETASAVEWYTK